MKFVSVEMLIDDSLFPGEGETPEEWEYNGGLRGWLWSTIVSYTGGTILQLTVED